jgi:hypothetical protein
MTADRGRVVLPKLPRMDHPTAPLRQRGRFAASWNSWITSDPVPTGPAWMQLLWTVLFGFGIALVFTLVGMATASGRNPGIWLDGAAWLRWYRVNLVISLSVALTIHALFATLVPLVGADRVRRFTRRQRALFFGGIPIIGVLVGWPLGVWLVGPQAGWIRINPAAVGSSVAIGIVISTIIYLIMAAKADQAVAEKRATEAQLRLLQAQIEPHFLFNTLANVHALIEFEPAKAKTMLGAFTDYLRSSLGSLRRDRVPLADELALAEAYLRVQQARMEDRLHFAIEVDAAARQALLPPLLLQPLVENAIQHGLEPSLGGGSVHIHARLNGPDLLIDVRDDGRGPATTPARPGNGVALANIRERLQQRHGERASLVITPADPGTRASLRLPFERAGAAEAQPAAAGAAA